MSDPALIESRIQLHYAVQFIAATGAALATPQPDYSHTSMGWNRDRLLFTGRLIDGDPRFRVDLDPVGLVLLIFDSHGEPLADLSLNHKTLEEGLDWLKTQIANFGVDAEKVRFLDYPPDDFPDHAIAHGAAFDGGPSIQRKQLADLYDLSYTLFLDLPVNQDDVAPIRIWPHHLDLATQLSIPAASDETTEGIGVGFSPGDANDPEPYWYVTPWSYSSTDNLPELEGNGQWHREHWFGAILPLSSTTEPVAQSQLQDFLESAIAACRQL